MGERCEHEQGAKQRDHDRRPAFHGPGQYAGRTTGATRPSIVVGST
jgi:hypothetical protein